MLIYILLWVFATISIIYCLFLFIFEIQLQKLWQKIYYLFQKRIQLIPSLYEVSKNDIIKSEEIFSHIFELNIENFWNSDTHKIFVKNLNTQQKIHKEFDFIFRVCMKHPKLIKNYKFYYIKEEIFKTTIEISDYLEIYKKMVKKFNIFRSFKFLTLIWIFIPIQKKEEI